eukprot:882405-Pleurochrysis_carterae.AAC.1
MALVAQTGSNAVTDHNLDAPVVCRMCMISRFVRCASGFRQIYIWVSSKVNELSGQINGATGNASGTLT